MKKGTKRPIPMIHSRARNTEYGGNERGTIHRICVFLVYLCGYSESLYLRIGTGVNPVFYNHHAPNTPTISCYRIPLLNIERLSLNQCLVDSGDVKDVLAKSRSSSCSDLTLSFKFNQHGPQGD